MLYLWSNYWYSASQRAKLLHQNYASDSLKRQIPEQHTRITKSESPRVGPGKLHFNHLQGDSYVYHISLNLRPTGLTCSKVRNRAQISWNPVQHSTTTMLSVSDMRHETKLWQQIRIGTYSIVAKSTGSEATLLSLYSNSPPY